VFCSYVIDVDQSIYFRYNGIFISRKCNKYTYRSYLTVGRSLLSVIDLLELLTSPIDKHKWHLNIVSFMSPFYCHVKLI